MQIRYIAYTYNVDAISKGVYTCNLNAFLF